MKEIVVKGTFFARVVKAPAAPQFLVGFCGTYWLSDWNSRMSRRNWRYWPYRTRRGRRGKRNMRTLLSEIYKQVNSSGMC